MKTALYIASQDGIFTVQANDPEMKAALIDDQRIKIIYTEDLKRGADGCVYGVTSESDIFSMKDGRITGFWEHDLLGLGTISCVLPDPENSGKIYIDTIDDELIYGTLDKSFKPESKVNTLPISNARKSIFKKEKV